MADRGNIPNSPACGLWETLLADALDGLLRPEDEATFASHMASCASCTSLFEEARKGREWLEFLSPEPEVPEGLLDKILVQTGPGHTEAEYKLATVGNVVPMAIPAWQRPGMMGRIRRFAEPRLLMTAAMAFFSVALTLNMTGVRLTDFRLSNLRPTAVRSFMERRLNMASTPIIRYYDHLRLVYEVEARMKELRRNSQQQQQQTPPAGPGESKQNPNRKDGGSRVDPPQQSGAPALKDSDYLETSVTLHDRQVGPAIETDGLAYQSAHSGGCSLLPGYDMAGREGSTVWTA
jgi:hypothetical protein